MMQKIKLLPTPDLPHPAPETWLLGPDPPGGKIFLQKPHTCVFKMISATKGSF